MSEKLSEKHHDSSDENDGVVRRGSKIDVQASEVLADSDLLHDAYDGENREHAMGLWEAAKTHPKACAWATIMCFTIVSRSPRTAGNPHFLDGTGANLDSTRSWKRSTCF